MSRSNSDSHGDSQSDSEEESEYGSKLLRAVRDEFFKGVPALDRVKAVLALPKEQWNLEETSDTDGTEDSDEPTTATALVWAAAAGNDTVVRLLLESGANAHYTCASDDRTALHWAINKGQMACAIALADAGAALSSGSESLLKLAVESGSPQMVQWVLEAGHKSMSTPGALSITEAREVAQDMHECQNRKIEKREYPGASRLEAIADMEKTVATIEARLAPGAPPYFGPGSGSAAFTKIPAGGVKVPLGRPMGLGFRHMHLLRDTVGDRPPYKCTCRGGNLLVIKCANDGNGNGNHAFVDSDDELFSDGKTPDDSSESGESVELLPAGATLTPRNVKLMVALGLALPPLEDYDTDAAAAHEKTMRDMDRKTLDQLKEKLVSDREDLEKTEAKACAARERMRQILTMLGKRRRNGAAKE